MHKRGAFPWEASTQTVADARMRRTSLSLAGYVDVHVRIDTASDNLQFDPSNGRGGSERTESARSHRDEEK
jgi:hypothetical protein